MLVEKPPRAKIIVFGIAFWYPLGGVVYQFLHFLIGLRRLGYDVYYVEDSGRYVYDPSTNDFNTDATSNINAVAPVLDAHGFEGKWVFRGNYPGGRTYGMTESQLEQLYRDADAFLNVTGGQELRDEHLKVPRRIYVETDPVVSQIKVAEGDQETIDQLAAHDTHFTYGENLGNPDCLLPRERFDWMPTRQPVVMEFWRDSDPARGECYNTITTWQNKGRDIVYKGETYYWSKHHEFLKFIDLPLRVKQRLASSPSLDASGAASGIGHLPRAGRGDGPGFELAVGVDEPTGNMLHGNGWRLTSSIDVSRDFARYRRYILDARGEFTVAKDQNIRLRSGWFSDRSACYLAAGRPVINQDTAFGVALPTGQGLFSFRTMDDILIAIDTIERDYPAACRAARDVAAEYFAAEKVLASLMRRARL